MRTPRRGSRWSADRVARRAVYAAPISSMAWQEHRRTWYLRVREPHWFRTRPPGVPSEILPKRSGHLDRLTYQRLGAAELEEVSFVRGQDELGFDVDPFEKAFGQLAGPVHWPSLTEAERPQAFAELRDWVEQLAQLASLSRSGDPSLLACATTGWSRRCPPCAITSECRSPTTDPPPAPWTGSARSGRSRCV